MEVFLKTIEGDEHPLEISERTTVGEVKQMASGAAGVDKAMFHLEVAGAVRMNESEVVSTLGVCFGDVIEMVVSEWWPIKGLQTKYKIAKFGDEKAAPLASKQVAAIDVTGIDATTGKQIWKTEGRTHKMDNHQSIVGIDKGCLGMYPGEIRCLKVPPAEGYPYGHPQLGVPARTELIFEIVFHRVL